MLACLRRLCVCLVWLLLNPVALASNTQDENQLPVEVTQALNVATSLELYSLEPWSTAKADQVERLYRYEVLGKASLQGTQARRAISEFQKTVARWNGGLWACFDPRHALRVRTDQHHYDLLLCFACHAMAVYRDGEFRVSLGASGNPEALDQLLTAAGLRLSQTAPKPASAEALAKQEADKTRWLNGMPSSLRPLRMKFGVLEDYLAEDIEAKIDGQYPDRKQRIRALLKWYGSGAGPWDHYPAEENLTESLLLGFTTAELLAAVDLKQLDSAQLEGTARLFAGWNFQQYRTDDHALLSAEFKQALLQHVLQTGDPKDFVRHQRARRAFDPGSKPARSAPPPPPPPPPLNGKA